MQNKMVKRCLAAFVAVVLVGGVTFSLPTTVAADNYVNSDEIEPGEGGLRNVNEGDTVTNVTPTAPINHNGGRIGTVQANASVYTTGSNTNIDHNHGTVTQNYGSIHMNHDDGTVTNNNDYINTNYGTVVNNYGGTVFNEDGGFVQNQFYYIVVTMPDGADVSYDSGITDPIATSNVAGYERPFIQVTRNRTDIDVSGVITISPDADHEIAENGQNVNPGNITYTLDRQNNGSYVITITAISANTILRHSDLGLTVRQLLDVPDNVIIRVAPDIQIEDEPSGNRVTESSPAAGNVITAAQISAMIESALAANPDATVLDIDLGNDPSLDADVVLALCDIKIAKNCHFTHNGIKFVLFVPVVDTDSASFKQCLALIDAEEGKQAGPIRLSLLFKPVGFDCLGE